MGEHCSGRWSRWNRSRCRETPGSGRWRRKCAGWEWKQPELLQSQFKSICICLVHSSSPSILTLSPFLSSGLIHTFRLSRSLWMSQQSTAAKPSLQGVRIKARKGAVKAQAKHEPSGPSPVFLIKIPLHTPLTHALVSFFLLCYVSLVFRDQLYKHLEAVPQGDFDGYTNKLVQAGSTLEFLKYADALFEILLVGGLLQPGGSYVEDGAPSSPFSIFNAQEPVDVVEIKKYVEVLNKLIRRCAFSLCICVPCQKNKPIYLGCFLPQIQVSPAPS